MVTSGLLTVVLWERVPALIVVEPRVTKLFFRVSVVVCLDTVLVEISDVVVEPSALVVVTLTVVGTEVLDT